MTVSITPPPITKPLDMEGKRIYNLGAPVDDNDAARKVDVAGGAVGIVPIGGVVPWLKTFGIYSGTNTSYSENKLIDSSANFITAGIKPGRTIKRVRIFDGSTYSTRSTSFVLVKTLILTVDSSVGFLINKAKNEIRGSGIYNALCYMKFYYTDGSNANSSTQSAYVSWEEKTYSNPYPSKNVWKIEVYLRSDSSSGDAYCRNNRVDIPEATATIISVDSGTMLTISHNIFLGLDYEYIIYPTSLPPQFVECNGQTLNDPESPYHGMTIPNLNGAGGETKYFLRGSTTSGTTGGSETHYHTVTIPAVGLSTGPSTCGASGTYTTNTLSHLPPFYEVVWVMRIK
jgi:hypothetical protein